MTASLITGNFRDKGLNFAKSKSQSDSLEEQARDLVSAMEADKSIDMNKHWKVCNFKIYMMKLDE